MGLLDPHHQSDLSHPYKVCLIVGDEGDGTVSGFVLHPLGGPGSPYFQIKSEYLFDPGRTHPASESGSSAVPHFGSSAAVRQFCSSAV